MKLDLKSRWKRLGKVDKTFAILLLAYAVLLLLAPGSFIGLVLQFALIVLGSWMLLRLARVGVRQAIWRLRNRLIVAYLLIAVVPILLILTLAGLGAYILASQVAVYLARSELDRRVTSMQAATEVLMRTALSARAQTLRQTGEIYRERFPDIVLMIDDGESVLRWPEDSKVSVPSAVQGEVSGIALLDGHYYAWSHAGVGGTQFVAATRLTRRYLSEMLPGLGEVYLLRLLLRGGKFEMVPAASEPAGTSLPPPVSRFDLEVGWGSMVPVSEWTDPGKSGFALLLVHTRLSAMLDLVFSRKVDELEGLVPILLGVAIAFLLVEMVSLGIGVSLTRTITGAVHSLYEGTERVMEGSFSHRIGVSGRDQLGDLSRSFNTMTENLERLLAVAKEKERMQAEFEIAREVQEQLYPKTIPILKTLRVMGLCHPARMVSGDYYDYQKLAGGKLAIAIGDVAGKGISAALLMATIQSAMRMELRSCLESWTAPAHSPVNGVQLSTARMVSELNQQLHATTSAEKFATFCFAIYDENTGVFRYTNAGHMPPILIRDGGSTRLDINGTVVGAFPFSKYDESEVELHRGDLLVCYTDGITEPENEYGEMFGEERLIELIGKHSDREDRQIIDTVMESVRQWTGVPELSDDMTVLLVRKQ